MIDRLEAMSIFRLVAERGSFTSAAKVLGMPLSTVSRKVAELETHIGSRLLLRSTRKLALTQAGEDYLTAARTILEQVEAAERSAAGEFANPSGELVLSAPVAFGRLHLLPVVVEFLAAHPKIQIRLRLSDRNLDLVEDQVDMVVRIGHLPDSRLIATRVGDMRQVVCASPELIASHGLPERPEDLAEMPCVTFDFEGATAQWAFRAPERQSLREAAIQARLSVSTADAAVWAAEQGVGATRVLHYQCADGLRRGALKVLLAAFEPPPLPVSVLHAPRGRLPLKMRSFLDFAAPRLKARLEEIACLEASPN